ncbi:MAG: vWA domain-containing protein [Acidimicrobiales bacterium]
MAAVLADQLRQAGIAVGVSNVSSFVGAIGACRPERLSSLYWLARVTLIQDPACIPTFDAVFAALFTAAGLSLNPQAPWPSTEQAGDMEDELPALPAAAGKAAEGAGLPWATLVSAIDASSAHESLHRLPERLPSSLESIAGTPLGELDQAGTALLDEWLAAAMARWPTRPSRRARRYHGGQRVALRPTIAAARTTGYEVIQLVRERSVARPRRLVMICDVSQSMEHYAASYFHLARAAVLSTDAEVFAFATRLTRLTVCLKHSSPAEAMERGSAKAEDRHGGTRIATNLRALLASRHGNSCRGAIVLVASDGWDSDPPEELARVMARLRRRAYRLVWVNPRASAPGYAPKVGAMAAALPFCDDFLPADTVGSLALVVEAIVSTANRRLSSTASRAPTV